MGSDAYGLWARYSGQVGWYTFMARNSIVALECAGDKAAIAFAGKYERRTGEPNIIFRDADDGVVNIYYNGEWE